MQMLRPGGYAMFVIDCPERERGPTAGPIAMRPANLAPRLKSNDYNAKPRSGSVGHLS